METETQQPESEIIDLGFDVTEADVARPVIKAGTFDATISFVRQENTRKQGLPQLLVGYRLTEPSKDVNGKDINPGFSVIQRVLLAPTGDYTEAMKKDRLGRIHFAACGPGKVTTAEWVGKPVRVRVTLREPTTNKETGESYDAQNDVGGVYPPRKSA